MYCRCLRHEAERQTLYLWAAILPCLDVVSEMFAGPAAIAKIHNLALSSQQPRLKGYRDSFLTSSRLSISRLINSLAYSAQRATRLQP